MADGSSFTGKTLPKDVARIGEGNAMEKPVKLFGKWDTEGYVPTCSFRSSCADSAIDSVEVKDISLTDYIQIRHAVWLPHTAGRYAKKQFKKAQMPIVERLVDRYVHSHWQ